MNILVKDGEIVGFTELDAIAGYEVIPAPEDWDGEDIERLECRDGKILLLSEEEYKEKKRTRLIQEKIEELNDLTDEYFYKEAAERGNYKNMGEILYDAQQGDPDATFLKQLYDAIWAKEEELEAQLEQMTLDQLLKLDLENWAKEIYAQVKTELENQQTEQTTEQ